MSSLTYNDIYRSFPAKWFLQTVAQICPQAITLLSPVFKTN